MNRFIRFVNSIHNFMWAETYPAQKAREYDTKPYHSGTRRFGFSFLMKIGSILAAAYTSFHGSVMCSLLGSIGLAMLGALIFPGGLGAVAGAIIGSYVGLIGGGILGWKIGVEAGGLICANVAKQLMRLSSVIASLFSSEKVVNKTNNKFKLNANETFFANNSENVINASLDDAAKKAQAHGHHQEVPTSKAGMISLDLADCHDWKQKVKPALSRFLGYSFFFSEEKRERNQEINDTISQLKYEQKSEKYEALRTRINEAVCLVKDPITFRK